jgi:hypothetical protein
VTLIGPLSANSLATVAASIISRYRTRSAA